MSAGQMHRKHPWRPAPTIRMLGCALVMMSTVAAEPSFARTLRRAAASADPQAPPAVAPIVSSSGRRMFQLTLTLEYPPRADGLPVPGRQEMTTDVLLEPAATGGCSARMTTELPLKLTGVRPRLSLAPFSCAGMSGWTQDSSG